ncbi:capsule assembly Wzi family protein [Marinobacter sp. TBZ242]|uniref:Capsule assembly Wzi family protein n=1 Tax=Marinobacter azerbaijanicus TaxID=3050455 RepID=A0ABT7IED3_9GAMM|nr:capsule assembly Wzi family protein [Marinobacter sp. TBZ242]MDL0431998.1 capsule assembly Wzi family protein [Marinobacter sp. TBZ242]
MTLKHWTLVGGAVACLIVSAYSTIATAAPWLEPGDNRARFALQKLADRGHLNRTTSTWPVMMGTVHSGLGRETGSDTRAIGGPLAYLKFEMDRQGKQGWRAEYELGATSEPAVVRGFQAGPRENAETSLNVQWQGESWAFGLKPGLAVNPEDDESLRLDGSYLAATAGNWVFGAGTIDRWWGPGWQSSLILSNNARPMPAVWLNRKDASAPESDWLKWVGPWQFTVFAGQLEDERAVPEAKLIGMRLTVRPIEGLDIGFSRAIMFGGKGRSESASTLWDALIGRDNSQDGAENDPGNQLGSIDARYGFAIGDQSMGVYAQMMGEDEAGAFPARKSWLLGTDWTTQVLKGDQQWFLEYTNTLADDFLGDAMPNISFEHFQYRTGFRYHGRNMASVFDGDAEAITLGAHHFLPSGSNFTAKVSYVELNKDGGNRVVIPNAEVFYTVPADSQNVAIIDLGYGVQALNGWLNLTFQATDKKIEYISGKKDQWSLGASWTYRL